MTKYIMFNMETQQPGVVEGPEADALFASGTLPEGVKAEVLAELQRRRDARRTPAQRGGTR